MPKDSRYPVIGLTGGVGAGKSTVLSFLQEKYGFYVIQADLTARSLKIRTYRNPECKERDPSEDP